MIYGSIQYINRMMIIDIEAEDIPVKRWILSLCLPIGFILLLLQRGARKTRVSCLRGVGVIRSSVPEVNLRLTAAS